VEEMEEKLEKIFSSAKGGILSGQVIFYDETIDLDALVKKHNIKGIHGCTFSYFGKVHYDNKPTITLFDTIMNTNKYIYGLETLPAAIDAIHKKFDKKFHYLYFFILHKFPKKPTRLASFINSASRCTFDVEDKDTILAMLQFGSTDFKDGESGWGSIPKKTEYFVSKIGSYKDHKTEMGLIISRPNSIYLYDWGFRIETSGHVDLVAIMSSHVQRDRKYFTENLGKKWEMPVKNDLFDRNSEPIKRWMLIEDDLSDLFGEEKNEFQVKNYGQRNLDIDLE
jgi:hypothetical protein